MTPYKYEVVFYQNKRFTGMSTFPDFKEASEHLVACIERYMESDGFFVNSDSSYCVTVFDLSSKEHMIQLLGPISEEAKISLRNKFDAINLQWAKNIIQNR